MTPRADAAGSGPVIARPPRRLVWRVLAWTLGLLLAVLALPPTLVAVGVTVDASPWRAQVAAAIGQALRREVSFDGPARITFSLTPELLVGGIRIRNPPGFGEPDFATFGEGRFKLELMPLLRYALHVRDFSARDVRVRLEIRADGRNNWQFGAESGAGSAPPGPSAASAPAAGGAGQRPAIEREDVSGIAIDRVRMERIALEFAAAGAPVRRFSLDSLEAEAPEGQPLRLRMRGQVEASFPYTVNIQGGSLSALVAGREAWPLKLELAFAGTALGIDGSLVGRQADGRADFGFTLSTQDLSQLERLLQLRLPPVGEVSLAARVGWSPGRLRLQDLAGRVGRSTLGGALELQTAGPVPRVSGALILPTLDLQPFLAERGTAAAPAAAEEPASLLATYRELQAQTFDLRRLAAAEADLKLEVLQWLNLPGEVRDASLAVQLQGGRLVAPMSVQAAGARLQGVVAVDASAPSPVFALSLSTRDTPLGGLARLLANLRGLEGRVDHFSFGLNARGATVGDLAQTLAVDLAIDQGQLSYGNAPGARPVSLRLDQLRVGLPGGKPLQGQMRGALVGEPFDVEARGGSLPALARGESWPIELQARASGARLQARGRIDALTTQPGGELRLDVQAPRAGSLARWLGLSPQAQAPFALGATLSARADSVQLRNLSLVLGRTRAQGEFSLSGIGQAGRRPLARLRLDLPEVDLAQLQTFVPPAGPAPAAPTPPTSAPSRTLLELPILPRGIDLGDTDFALTMARLRLPTAEVTGLRFEGRVRDGHMPAAPFAAVVAGTPFRGTAAVDLRGALPEVALSLQAERVDVGDLLRRLQVAEGVDARVESMQLSAVLRGAQLGEALERSQLQADLRGGRWTLRNPAGQPLVSVALDRGRLEAPPGAPLALRLDGHIDGTPVNLRLGSGRLADLARPGARVPFSLGAEAAGTRLDIDGSVRVPLSQRGGDLTLRLAGARLDSLNRLAHADLPPWGPWLLAGRFAVAGSAYEMPSLELRVGSSRLEGRGSLGFDGERPRALLALRAPTVQLDDFRFGDWSPTGAKPPAPAKQAVAPAPGVASAGEALRTQARDAARESQRLLSRQTLLRQEFTLDVEVAQVQSGRDLLGSGSLQLRLKDSRLTLAPAEVRVPGGSARLELSYEPLPGDREVALSSRLRVERFDYGILARRIQPDSDQQGLFSLGFELKAQAPLEQLMQRGSGRLDVAVWPVNLKAGLFDLWAVNLLAELLPTLDASAASRVNCAVARFDLTDGRLREETLVVDTTRLRASGTVRVDFRDESIAVRLQPRAKQAQFFALPVPVEVNGSITAPKIGVSAGSALGAAAGFLGSLVTTPLRRLTETPLPADGSDVCQNTLRPTTP